MLAPLIFLIFLTHSSSHFQLGSYLAYGNELEAARRLWEHGKTVDEAAYDTDFQKCNLYDPWCIRATNYKYASTVAMWEPDLIIPVNTGDRYYRRRPDCQYSIELTAVFTEKHWEVFHFAVHQQSCRHRLSVELGGGSTFSAFATSSAALVACTSHDHFDGVYDLQCRLPHSSSAAEMACAQLTVLLEHEHYDAFSAVLGSSPLYDYLYPPIRLLIADNFSYCGEAKPSGMSTGSSRLSLDKLSEVAVIAGSWQPRHADQQPSLYEVMRSSGKLVSAREFYRAVGRLVDYQTVPFDLHFPALTMLAPTDLADSLVFQPMLAHAHGEEVLVSWNHSLLPFKHIAPSSPDPVPVPAPLHHYHFLGSSHMRYDFDNIIALLFGEQYLPSSRKYNVDDLGSLHHSSGIRASVTKETIANLCAKGFPKNGTRNTIIFQFGAWDLWQSPLQLLVNGSRGAKLIAELARILTNPASCPGLVHVVYVTMTPYPLCFDERDDYCHNLRGHNNNAASAALNRYFIEELLNIKRRYPHSLKLSIVDAYSIIKPRLVLSNDNEVTCSTHYLCREDYKGQLRVITTPAGYAVLEAIFAAIDIPESHFTAAAARHRRRMRRNMR